MLGLRLRMDCAQRWKNGQAAHNTTGVLSTSSIQVRAAGDSAWKYWPNIASTSVATLSGRVHQKRRRKSVSSGFSPSSSEGIIGSSAMPQIGQVPGPSRTISGCIGQVYCAPGTATSGSRWGASQRGGSATNLVWQPAEQK